jgi:alkylation response protein AidB-like acyl-CoA dehydrogenase
LTDGALEARAFADSVAGVLDRHRAADGTWPGLTDLLDELGWDTLSGDPELVRCAGLGAVELGRRLAPVSEVDRLLGASPMAGHLFRSPLAEPPVVLMPVDDVVVRREVLRAEPTRSAGGLDVHRALELGPAQEVEVSAWWTASAAWTVGVIGYLAGIGQSALDLTVEYVRQRRAFGSTLAVLGPVQQLLAEAATIVRGVQLLAAEPPHPDALAHAGPAITEACAACHQVTGAIGFTLEHPLPHHSQCAIALATWNDALLDGLLAVG